MVSHWKVLPADPPLARRLADALGIHQVTAQLLLHRGVRTPEQAAHFLSPSLRWLDDPLGLPDMARGVERLRQAIARREPIVIFGDSDVDGLTASVILYEALHDLGAKVQAQSANRVADGYGLPDTLLGRLCRSSTKLVILVDCGTNQPEAVRTLAACGIDTIIVDHHVPLEGWAAPHALINPHRGQNAPPTSSFGTSVAHPAVSGVPGLGRELCSAGLAFNLVRALSPDAAEACLDLATLGTLADCSPLHGQNRWIVSAGLARVVRSQRPGLQRLCEATGVDAPEPEQMIRRLIPRLNASGRLGHPRAVWHLLRRDGYGDLEEWLEAAESAHTTTKHLHRQTLGQAQEQVNRLHFRDQYVMVVSREGWPQGLMGPLASQLAERYGRPTIAIALGRRQGIGSGRSVPMFNLLNALRSCQEVLVKFGGHAQACGLTIDSRHLEPFRELVNRYAREHLGVEGLRPTQMVDLELTLDAVDTAWVGDLERFAPFGRGNARPTVVIRRLHLEMVSARAGWVSDGVRRVKVRGSVPSAVPGVSYDVAAAPIMKERQLLLSLCGVKPAAEPSAPAPISGTLYRRGSASRCR